MTQIVIITATGARDKPGIIAGLTGAVFHAGGNLDDATMTRLHGAFANVLVASLPDPASVDRLEELLAGVGASIDLRIHVELIPDVHEDVAPDHVLTVYGGDKPGIAYRITSVLADLGVNVTDLDTRLAGTVDKAIYVMALETSGGDWSIVGPTLVAVAADLGVEVSYREIETESL